MTAHNSMVYLATPYTHAKAKTRDMRVQTSIAFEKGLTAAGLMVYNPLRYTAQEGIAELADDQRWREHGLRMLMACDIVVVLQLPGWDKSIGVRGEVALANDLGKPIYYHVLTGPPSMGYTGYCALANAYTGRLQ